MKKKIGIIFLALMMTLVMGFTGCTRNNDVLDDQNTNNATEKERKVGDSGTLNEGVAEPRTGLNGDTTDTGEIIDDNGNIRNNDNDINGNNVNDKDRNGVDNNMTDGTKNNNNGNNNNNDTW